MDINFISALNDEMRAHFPLLQNIGPEIEPGQIVRLDSTKNNDKAAWLMVYENEYKGNMYYNAVFGNWRDATKFTFSSYDKNSALARKKEFREAAKKCHEIAKQKIEDEQRLKHETCQLRWFPFFQSLPTNSPVHPYLANKKLDSNFIARVTDQNVLFVPGFNATSFVGGQRIFMNPETHKFEKRYTFGIAKTGSFVPFGKIRTAKYVYIAEGFATAASVFTAFRDNDNIAVIAAWDTSNLYAAAASIRSINPNSFLIFAADRDLNSKNVGERKAREAAAKFSNAVVIVAKFSDDYPELSDFNDLHVIEGIDAVRAQLTVQSSDFIEIIPLGFNKDKYYYFNTLKKQIVEFSKSDHNPNYFMLNAPRKYWGDRFGYLTRADGSKSTEPNWKLVVERLGIESAEKGVFNNNKIRGLGVWDENGKIVVNVGDQLFYNGKYHPLFNNDLNTDYFYQSAENVKFDFNNILTDIEAREIVDAFKLLKYKNAGDYIILAGWIFNAQIFAALQWRPHLWLTGERGTGKSTIIKYIAAMIPLAIMIQNSTAAGIRQRLENSAIPLIYDESEPDSEKGRERVGEVIEIARQTSTRSKYEILRGSAGGRAASYNTNTVFCMASIQISDLNSADLSRFFIVEMQNVKNQNHEEFIKIENAMNDIQKYAGRLFARAVSMYSQHVRNIEIVKEIVKAHKIESRQADQLAPIVAGFWAYFSTGEINEDFVITTINEMEFTKSDYVKNNEENDSEKCLNDIFAITVPGWGKNIGQIISQYCETSNVVEIRGCDDALGLFGMRFFKPEHQLFVPNSDAKLKTELEKISKYSDFKNLLKRHPAFLLSKNERVAGRTRGGIKIQLE